MFELTEEGEWRTLALLAFVYLAWGALLFTPGVPLALRFLLLIPVVTLHSSLQHEVLHGHPFRNEKLNSLLVYPPLGLLVPFERFKQTHLQHHRDSRLTDPYEDPESWYLYRKDLLQYPAWFLYLLRINNSLLGRILLGPALAMNGFWRKDFEEITRGNRDFRRIWGFHILWVAILLTIVGIWSPLGTWLYLMVAYFGFSLLTVRTFLEHQARDAVRERTVIIGESRLLSWLFLNNNLHAVHHVHPRLPWYRLPETFKARREDFLKLNKGYYFRNYLEIFKAYAFRAKEPVEFPLKKGGR